MPKSILLMDKQARMLVALKDQMQSWYISSLAKATGTTYVHACNFLLECERLGIVRSEKHGKIKTIRLTEKGAQIAELVSGIYSSIRQEPAKPEAAKEQAPQAKAKPEEKEKDKEKEKK